MSFFKPENKCKHGRDAFWCCACRYGERSYITPDRTRDLVDDLKTPDGYKLIRGINEI